MSDDFVAGDWAARVPGGIPDPHCQRDVAMPPLGAPILVLAALDHPRRQFRQGLTLAGYPLKHGFWNSHFFRKVPPPNSIEEPRRAEAPRELEPA